MWKKLALFCGALVFAVPAVQAYFPGDTASGGKNKLEWINCSPMVMGKLDSENSGNIPDLRAVVFMLTRAQDSDRTMAILNDVRRRFAGKVLIAGITPDDVSDAKVLLQRHPDSRIRFAVDMDRKFTPLFMNDTAMLFPMAFLMDRHGIIIWRGEVPDLAEAAEDYYNGTMNVHNQRECAKVIQQMQQAMRDGNMLKIIALSQAAFALDPGNPTALRMALFAAESIHDINRAWNIVYGQYKFAERKARIGFMALDMIIRYQELQKHLESLIDSFSSRDYPPMSRCAFADALLNNFHYSYIAVLGAKKVLERTPLPTDAPADLMALTLAVKARLFYALGDLPGAIENQKEAVQMFKHAGDDNGRKNAEKNLKFFEVLLKNSPAASANTGN